MKLTRKVLVARLVNRKPFTSKALREACRQAPFRCNFNSCPDHAAWVISRWLSSSNYSDIAEELKGTGVN